MIGDLNGFDNISEEVDFLWVLYFFFFAATILLTISMLNLLIAIISDTFSKVKNAENLTKIWERWNIITEIDTNLHAKGNIIPEIKGKEFQYLLVIYNERHIKNERKETMEIQNSIELFKENTEIQFKNTETTLNELKQSFDEIKKSVENVQTTMEKNMENIMDALKNIEAKNEKAP